MGGVSGSFRPHNHQTKRQRGAIATAAERSATADQRERDAAARQEAARARRY